MAFPIPHFMGRQLFSGKTFPYLRTGFTSLSSTVFKKIDHNSVFKQRNRIRQWESQLMTHIMPF
jgi:hypothetical protein